MKRSNFLYKLNKAAKKRDEMLAPYAQKSCDSRGREFKEQEHPMRSPFQRDRDRIVHSRAFRRLEYKTQVFINHEGDHYRTRLTHTIEVSTIARTIAKALFLNEDLAEAIALAHDVGHPPFGHTGEDILDELMHDEGGFEHNLQSLRIVEKLERKYPVFKGLNLSWEVREGIIKHRSSFDEPAFIKKYNIDRSPLLEAQIVDFSDEIAYTSHDLDDGLLSGLIDERQLDDVTLWAEEYKKVKEKFPWLDVEVKRYYTVRNLIDVFVSDLIGQSYKNIISSKIKSVKKIKEHPSFLISFSKSLDKKNHDLKVFLMNNLYKHKKVVSKNKKARKIIRDIFLYYLNNPAELKLSTRKKTKERSLKRVICDYVAGMTDRYAIYLYKKLFPSKSKSFFEEYV